MRPADNPFRMEVIDRIAYRPIDLSWEELGARWEALGRRAAVLGARGSGKSRLLATFAARLEARGEGTLAIRCARDPLPAAGALEGRVLLADELDRLGPLARRRLFARARRARGLLVAAHRPPRELPVLHRCRTDAALVSDLVRDLTGAPPPPGLDALLARHRGDVRALLRGLYDDFSSDRASST